jgi:hypothetical protein
MDAFLSWLALLIHAVLQALGENERLRKTETTAKTTPAVG